MKITKSNNQTIEIREFSTSRIFIAFAFFLTGLAITINSSGNKNISVLTVFIAGPLLMALSIAAGLYAFVKITTIFDAGKLKAFRYRVKFNKKNFETITLQNVSCVEIENTKEGLDSLTSKKKYNLNLRYEDGDCVIINHNKISSSEAKNIGYKIAFLLNVPMKRIK